MLTPEAAVSVVLTHAEQCVATGYAAVVALNPFGAPRAVRSVALVTPPDTTPGGMASTFVDKLKAAGAESVKCTPTGPDGTILAISVNDVQVATLSAFPPELATLPVVQPGHLLHLGHEYPIQHFLPSVLRQQLTKHGRAENLLFLLDGFVAEQCLQAALGFCSFAPGPSVSSASSPPSAWALVGQWAQALLAVPDVDTMTIATRDGRAAAVPVDMDLLRKAVLQARSYISDDASLTSESAFLRTDADGRAAFLLLPLLGSPSACLGVSD